MALTNYHDLSKAGSHLGAGYQFEFYCATCPRTWKSPFKPYRRGQFAGLLFRVGRYIDSRGTLLRAFTAVSNAGDDGAREAALQDALELAAEHYVECPACGRAFCVECWDANGQRCPECRTSSGGATPAHRVRHEQDDAAAAAPIASTGAAPTCPNCSSAVSGGRFCPECGFDISSTHKSCPGCGSMCTRASRFCAECGHGF